MTRRLRDFAASVIALAALGTMLLSINPRLRERAGQMAGDLDVEFVRSTAARAASAALSVVQGYAGENAYLFTFLVAACVFVLLMLKVIS